MMGLAWWRLSRLLRQRQAAGVVLAALLVGGAAATAWPSSPPMASTGPLQLFRDFCVVQWLGAAAAALWASAAPDVPAGQTPDEGLTGDCGAGARLAWEDWFTYANLSPSRVALGLATAGLVFGAGVAVLALPLGAFAAAASGTGMGQLVGTTLLGFLASGAAAAWGTAIQAGSPEGLRTVWGAGVLAALGVVGRMALSPWLPGPGPAMLWAAGGLRFAAGLVAFGGAGGVLAVAAVRRHLHAAFVEGGERDAGGRQAS